MHMRINVRIRIPSITVLLRASAWMPSETVYRQTRAIRAAARNFPEKGSAMSCDVDWRRTKEMPPCMSRYARKKRGRMRCFRA